MWHNPAATIERILGYYIEINGGKIFGVEKLLLNMKLYLIARFYKFKYKFKYKFIKNNTN